MAALDLLGFVGMTLLLAGFLLNQLGQIHVDGFSYQILNMIGAYLLSYYAFLLSNTPFLILEFVWGSFSLYRIGTIWTESEPR